MKTTSKNPKRDIRPLLFDRLVEALGVFALLLLVGLPAWHYTALPETIPIHYGIDGQPDGYGPRWTVWILPAIGLVTYIGLAILTRFPHIYNYPVKITAENAESQYRMVCRFIRVLNTVIAGLFTYLTFADIQTALGVQNGPGSFFLPVFVLLIFGTIGFYLYKSMKKQ